ncbi:MAG: NYN domain-containing protein [Thermoleophilia bacterium]|nr:NYN domain-containing protein [Thermoleophilia bacterium]
MKLGELITAKSPWPRELLQVRVYRGLPDASKEPKTYAANRSQCAAWLKRGQGKLQITTRPLRYPKTWPLSKPQEKGIDVALAIDFVTMAVLGQYDVGIIMSTDTDLKPALEAVLRLPLQFRSRCEVAAWTAPNSHARRLSVQGARLWCHWLGPDDYQQVVVDTTDYTLP